MSNIIQKARRLPNNPMADYALESDKKCGLFPHKYIDMEFSRRSDILRQAANRIVTGESTFASEVFTLAYYLTKFKRLDKPTSKKLLVTDLRRLVRKADIDNKFTSLYQYVHRKDAAIMKIVESAVENNAGAKARFHQIQYDRWYAKKQKQIEEYQLKVQEVREMNKKDQLARDHAYNQFRVQNIIVGEIADRCISPTLPPVSPAPALDDMLVFDNKMEMDDHAMFNNIKKENDGTIEKSFTQPTISFTDPVPFTSTPLFMEDNPLFTNTISFPKPIRLGMNREKLIKQETIIKQEPAVNIEEWTNALFA